jgi:hypothetical protein
VIRAVLGAVSNRSRSLNDPVGSPVTCSDPKIFARIARCRTSQCLRDYEVHATLYTAFMTKHAQTFNVGPK